MGMGCFCFFEWVSCTYDVCIVVIRDDSSPRGTCKYPSFTSITETLQKQATEMYKIKNNYSPVVMKSIFPESTNLYNLTSNNPFRSDNVHSVLNGTETLSYWGVKTWLMAP